MNAERRFTGDPPSRELMQRVGSLIASIGESRFGASLIHFLRDFAANDSAALIRYHRRAAPQVDFDELAEEDRAALYGRYFDGAYLLSPYYLRWTEQRDGSGLHRLQQIAPEGFFDSIYYTDYYGRNGLIDELAYLVPLSDDCAVLVSLGRTRSLWSYSDAECARLRHLEPLVDSAVRRHYATIRESADVSIQRQLSDSLTTFGADRLTPQEQRVVQLMLRGHSSKSCARELGISPTTERVHRRNIYAKLDISSQAELFTKFFDRLSHAD